MVVKLEKVVPFGRTFNEYQLIFNLTPNDLAKPILGVGDGPASFNATATAQGCKITSVDPIYQFTGTEIRDRFNAVVDDIITQVEATPQDWVCSYHQSPQDLRRNRQQALEIFLADYNKGKQESRYQEGALPKLDFPDATFNLALCSHLLFLYSAHYDYQFHYDSLQEMLRVSSEVRIFPLLTLMLERSPYLEPIMQELAHQGYRVSIVETRYELQRGGKQMLRIQKI
jgi:hypothetical protein